MTESTPNMQDPVGGKDAPVAADHDHKETPPTANPPAPPKASWGRRLWRGLKIGLIVLIGFYLLAAVAHPVTVFFWRFLPLFVLGGIGIGGGIFVARRWKAGRGPSRRLATIMSLLWLVLTAVATVSNVSTEVVRWQMAQSLEEHRMRELPDSHQTRLVARATAREYVKNATTDNRLKGKEPHLVRQKNQDGSVALWWQSPLAYNIWYGTPLGSVNSVVRVSASEPNMAVDKAGKNAFFLFGDDSWVTELIFRLRHPFSERGETVYWQKDNGEWVMLISRVSYRPTWTLTMIPEVAGVMEVGPYGGFSNYSPDEARRNFEGAALYPPELARRYADAYAHYHLGIMNTMFAQLELLEISESKSADDQNSFPYYQDFDGIGMQLVVPLEPRGGNSFALSRVLFFDAITGKLQVYVTPEDLTLNGPRKAMLNVHNAAPDADWSSYVEVEPKIVHGKHGSYWLVTVIRKDPNSHAFVMLVAVDMKTLRAHRFDDIGNFRTFLTNGTITQTPTR